MGGLTYSDDLLSGALKPMGVAGRVQADLVLAAIAPQAPLPGLVPRETGVTALMAGV